MVTEPMMRGGRVVVTALLLAGPTAAGERIDACMACHGGERPADGKVPALGGQPELYLLYQLFHFRDGQRQSEPMTRVIGNMSDGELAALAAELAGLPRSPPARGGNPDLYLAGEEVAARRRCGACHLPDFSGREQVPRLAGQQEIYLRNALADYQSGVRIGLQAAMAEAIEGLQSGELDALAHYLAHFQEN